MSMTIEKAIEEVRFNMSHIGLGARAARRVKEAKEMAILALEQVQKYIAIGTVSEFRELKEKATAIKADGFSDHLLNMGYTKGIKDGYAKAITEFAERLRLECLNNPYHEVWLHTMLKIATEMKGE